MTGATLRIAEVFASVQGEGFHAGRPMLFVRLQGCSVVACPLHRALCDTNWRDGTERRVVDLAAEVRAVGLPCCVTGGEPTDQAAGVEALMSTGAAPWWMLQTAGTAAAPGVDWLVVSPKVRRAALVQRTGDELKLLYEPGMTVDHLRAWEEETRFAQRFLQPVWQRRRGDSAAAAALLCEAGRAGLNWRLSCQAHKFAGLR